MSVLTKRVRIIDPATSPEEHSFTDFSFHMLYSFLDIDSDDVAKMHKELDWVISQFSNRTKVPAFRRLSARIKGYFQSHKYAARTYDASPYPSLQEAYTLSQYCNASLVTNEELLSISVLTQEAKVALITYNLALYRDFRPVLEEFSHIVERRDFIHFYGLILSDIHYLQFTKTLHKLKDKILSRLNRVYQEYFELEADENSSGSQEEINSQITAKIGPIAYLIFGLGLVYYYDSRENLGEISIKDLFFCQKSPEDWIYRHTSFMWEYFSDERIPYFISFLLHSLYPKLPQVRRQDRLVIEDLNYIISEFKRAFSDYSQALGDRESSSFKSKIQLINNNLDTVLIETGKYEQREKHQTIRYLHREVFASQGRS